MAFRRNLGQLANTLLQQHMQRKNLAYEDDLIRNRQAELSSQNMGQKLMENLAPLLTKGDISMDQVPPELRSFMAPYAAAAPSQAERASGVISDLGKAKTQADVPTEGVMAQQMASKKVNLGGDQATTGTGGNLGMLPTGMDFHPAEDGLLPSSTGNYQSQAWKDAKNTRQGVLGQIGLNQEGEADRKAAETFSTNYQTGMGTEAALEANKVPALAREKATGEQKNSLDLSKERSMNPILASRSQGNAFGASMGTFNAAQKQLAEDPALKALAKDVLANPALLDKVTPTERARLLKSIAMSPDQELQNKAQQASKAIITSAITAFMGMSPNEPGFAGAVGAKGPMSLFGLKEDPFAGSAAGDYATNEAALKAALTMPRLDVLRGLGHMSDREFGAVATSVTTLNRNKQSEAAYKQTLSEILPILRTSWTNAQLDPAEFDALTQGAYSEPPQPGAIDPAAVRGKLNAR